MRWIYNVPNVYSNERLQMSRKTLVIVAVTAAAAAAVAIAIEFVVTWERM